MRRFGSNRPYTLEDGKRFNLKHDTMFSPDQVKTDGAGNVLVMPLLVDKPCFGRPERFVRGSHEKATPPLTGRNRTGDWQLTRCQRCPVVDSCVAVAAERIESSSTISTRFEEWDDWTAVLPDDDRFKGQAGRLWGAFLRSIERHGRWTNVNDANVVEAALAAALKRAQKQRMDRKIARAKARMKRRGMSQPVTPAFMTIVEEERKRRAEALLDLRTKPYALRYLPSISRLPPEGCERTADVWAAKTILEKADVRATGKAIASYLTRHGRDRGVGLGTLTTWVYKDLNRIEKLERDQAGVIIWQPFRPGI